MENEPKKKYDGRANLKRGHWKKGESGNPNGRPKKLVSQLMINRKFSMSQINDIIQQLVGLTQPELQEISFADNATMIEKTVAEALLKSLQRGNLDAIETLLNRIYGKPQESVDITTKGDKVDNKIQIEIVKKQIINGES
jgi:Glu-tRNA(Gln) amidotransferase subunit E-like FAD-binding protein